MSFQPRLPIAFWLTSVTLMPVTIDERQAAVDQRPAELRLRRVGRIEVQRMLVHGEQREPGVVGLGDGAAGPVLVDVADLEVLVVAAEALAPAARTDFACDRASAVASVHVYHAACCGLRRRATRRRCARPAAARYRRGAAGSSRKRIAGAMCLRPLVVAADSMRARLHVADRRSASGSVLTGPKQMSSVASQSIQCASGFSRKTPRRNSITGCWCAPGPRSQSGDQLGPAERAQQVARRTSSPGRAEHELAAVARCRRCGRRPSRRWCARASASGCGSRRRPGP